MSKGTWAWVLVGSAIALAGYIYFKSPSGFSENL